MEDFNFKIDSGWSIRLELECFVIYKQLHASGFEYGLQADLCKKLAQSSGLKYSTVNAKVGNFKSEFNYIDKTNSSNATKYIAKKFGYMSLDEAVALLEGYRFCERIK